MGFAQYDVMDETPRRRGFAHTHVGRREQNEDSHLADNESGLFVVADGMGGYKGGEVASKIVVDRLAAFFSRTDRHDAGFDTLTVPDRPVVAERMLLAIRQANMEIQRRRRGHLARMGSTVAALLLRDDQALIAHVGDSRVYRRRDGVLERMTVDHSVYTEMVESGMNRSSAQNYRHMITRAVGVPGSCQPDMQVVETAPNDMFLLCSDGVSDVLADADIDDVMSEVSEELVARTLVSRAYMRGADDNITALVVVI
ncbi:MAG: protein phosphatase 2C domain-containing protein [Myxococcota bacterium]